MRRNSVEEAEDEPPRSPNTRFKHHEEPAQPIRNARRRELVPELLTIKDMTTDCYTFHCAPVSLAPLLFPRRASHSLA